MIKGGYKIVNFNGAALSGVSETLSGIYAQIVDDYDKPIMVSGVSLNGDIMDDAYAGVQEKIAGDLSKSVELTVYGGVITVTEDDEVTFALAKSNTELTDDVNAINQQISSFFDQSISTLDDLISKSVLGKNILVNFTGRFMDANFGTGDVAYRGFLVKATDTLVEMFAYKGSNGDICMGRYSTTSGWIKRFKTTIDEYTPS